MTTYRERMEILFNKSRQTIGLAEDDREVFIEWACERHIRLRQRDKKWIERTQSNQELPDCEKYFAAVCKAIECCEGKDYYTGKPLSWEITLKHKGNQQTEEEQDAKTAERQERVTFDHLNGRNLEDLQFALCAGKTNDAKNDLTKSEFVELCQAVVDFDKKKSLSGPSGL